MIRALTAAGFPGVEAEGSVIHARLTGSLNAFTATPEAEGWRLALIWPFRAGEDEIAEWNASHGEARVDLYRGETRLSLWIPAPPDPQVLRLWGEVAEEAVAAFIRWRRIQRAPGEGM